MERTELTQLMTADGLRLLDSLPAYTSKIDIVRTVVQLRKKGFTPELVAAVLTQSKLRTKAVAKLGEFAKRMLFTETGLEQATRLQVAALHAGRFRSAGLTRIADLGCGIGADALAFSALDLVVTAVENDEVTAAIAAYNLAPFPSAAVELGDATAFDVSRVDAVYLDPARRTSGHTNTSRLSNPDDFTPSLTFAFNVAAQKPTGMKVGPGLNRNLIPPEAEAQWISVDGHVVETGLWFGPLARPGIRRAALVLSESSHNEMTSNEDSPDVKTGPLGEFLYEPDGSVIRARLIGDLARTIDAHMLSSQIAYLTSDTLTHTPFATAFRVREKLSYSTPSLRRELRARGIGTLEIKKRGVDVDPAHLRTQLSLEGPNNATLIITRVKGRHTALLVDRV